MLRAFMNPKDSSRRSWDDGVCWFFKMNKDPAISSMKDIATMFQHREHPFFFRINSDELQPYFLSSTISYDLLQSHDCVEDDQFVVDDEDGIRLSFVGLTKFIISAGDKDLNQKYEFVSKVYQLHRLYITAKRTKTTHWTLIERTSHFIKNMKPHEHVDPENPRFTVMDTQPRVFCIIKGSVKSIVSRREKYLMDTEISYSSKFALPIYESVMNNLNDEISIFLKYLEVHHLTPYRKQQLNGMEGKKITNTKCNLRLTKRFILIDPSQDAYTPDMLQRDIDDVRTKLKYGQTIEGVSLPTRKEDTTENFTDLQIFKRTNGKYMDDLQSIELNPVNDDDIAMLTNELSPIGQFTKAMQFMTLIEEELNRPDQKPAQEDEDEEDNDEDYEMKEATVVEDAVVEVEDDDEDYEMKEATVVEDVVVEEVKEDPAPPKQSKVAAKPRKTSKAKKEIKPSEVDTDAKPAETEAQTEAASIKKSKAPAKPRKTKVKDADATAEKKPAKPRKTPSKSKKEVVEPIEENASPIIVDSDGYSSSD